MRINDLQENIFQNLLGTGIQIAKDVSSEFKAARKSKNSFIDNFVSKAKDALSKAPKQDTANVKTANVKDKPQIDIDVDSAVKKMRTFQPTGTKILPSKFADELNKDIQYVSKNKDYLLRAASKIDKFDAKGYDMKSFYQNFMNQYALGKKQQTIQEDRLQEIYKKLTAQEKFRNALRKAGYDPDLAAKRIEDLLAKHRREREERAEKEEKMGLEEGFPWFRQKPKAKAPAPNPAQAKAMKRAPGDFAKPTGAKQASTRQQAGNTTQQLNANTADWFKKNFIASYFKDLPWQSQEAKIDEILAKMMQNYPKNLDQYLTSIAQIGWPLVSKSR